MKWFSIMLLAIAPVFLAIGCKDYMSELENRVNHLVSVTDPKAEAKAAKLASEFTNDNKINYSLRIKSEENEEAVPISQNESDMNNKLEVSLQVAGKAYTWNPINNEDSFTYSMPINQ